MRVVNPAASERGREGTRRGVGPRRERGRPARMPRRPARLPGDAGRRVPSLGVVGLAVVGVERSRLGVGVQVVFKIVPIDGGPVAHRQWKARQRLRWHRPPTVDSQDALIGRHAYTAAAPIGVRGPVFKLARPGICFGGAGGHAAPDRARIEPDCGGRTAGGACVGSGLALYADAWSINDTLSREPA